MQQTQTIKIFLGSSITELKDERVSISDSISQDLTQLFQQDNIFIHFFKRESIHNGYSGQPDQDEIDKIVRKSDVSLFVFKDKEGAYTIHEYEVARALQKERTHKIFVYYFHKEEGKQPKELTPFQERLSADGIFWKEYTDVIDLKYQFTLGLLKHLDVRCGASAHVAEEVKKSGDELFEQCKHDHKLMHQEIEKLLVQIDPVMEDPDTPISAKINNVIGIYQKADFWAAATAYDKEKYYNLLSDYAYFLYDYSLYYDSEIINVRAIALVEELYGIEHENTAIAYNRIGIVYYNLDEYEKALEYFGRALKIRERKPDLYYSEIATAYNNIGGIYRKLGKYRMALELYDKALEIQKDNSSSNSLIIADTYNNKGVAFRYEGLFKESLDCHLMALEIREDVLGVNHPDTAISYSNIGTTYRYLGNYDKALEYYQQALNADVTTRGINNDYTAIDYHNIGSVYRLLGNTEEALKYYHTALAIEEKILAPNHPNIANDYNNIGLVYDNQGDYVKAIEYLQKALEIREKFLGTEHPDTAQSYNNIGEVYREQGDYDKSLEYYQKALAIREFVFGPRHPDTAQSFNSIGSVYFSQGDYGKALEYDVKALAIMEKVLGTEHPYTAQSYSNIGLVYKEQGDYGKALEYLNKSFQIYKRVLGEEHPSTINVLEWIDITISISRSDKQKLPIGIQNFESLRKDKCAYVDKTQLVFDLVNDAKYVFLSRPRRFGKSLFMSTLKAYFEGKKELFEGLAISKLEKKWESFPILYLDLNVGMYDSVEGLVETLNSNLNDWEEEFGIKSNSTDVAQRFRSIIKKVAKKENRNVVILIDEYDKPLLQAIDNEPLQQNFRNILKAFFGNLKTCDEFIRFAMLTGVSKFSQISLFSDLNNLNDISLNEHYLKICGLTADEINKNFSVYLDDFVKQEKTDKAILRNQMRQMYGGYHFTEDTSIDMYNPFSVLNALLEKKFRDFWFSTGTPSFLIKLLQDGDYDLQKFSEGNIKANHLAAKESLIKEPIALFYQTGYLTIKEYNKYLENYSLGFPNREVEQGFLSFILPHYMGNTDERTTTFLGDIVNDLREGHIEVFLERMKSFFADTPYELIRDLESHYQNVMFTICRLTGYYTKAEYRTSNGRIDMVVKTEQYIYVFEFKFNKTAKEALKQIDTKEYLLPFRYDGRRLCKIGVNFSGESRNIDDHDFNWV